MPLTVPERGGLRDFANAAEPPEVGDVVVDERLGWLLRSYRRTA